MKQAKNQMLLQHIQNLIDEAHYTEALAQSKTLQKKYLSANEWENYAESSRFLVQCLLYTAQYQAAIEEATISSSVTQQHIGEEHLTIASLLIYKGLAHEKMCHYEEVLPCYQNALQLLLQYHPKEFKTIALSHFYLASYYLNTAKTNKALHHAQLALKLFIKTIGTKSLQVTMCHNTIACCHSANGHYKKALETFTKVLTLRKTLLPNNHPKIATVYSNLSYCHSELGDFKKALLFEYRAMGIIKESLGENHLNLTYSYHNIATLHNDLNEHVKAVEYNQKALKIRIDSLGINHTETASSYGNLGITYIRLQQHEKGRELLQKSLEIYTHIFGATSPEIAHVLDNIGESYLQTHFLHKAVHYIDQSLKIRLEIHSNKHPNVGNSYLKKGEVCFQLQKTEEALAYYQKAIEHYLPDFEAKDSYQVPNINAYNAVSYLLPALTAKARAFEALSILQQQVADNLKAAYAHYQAAIGLLYFLGQHYDLEASKLNLAAQSLNIYQKVIAVGYQLFKLSRHNQYAIEAFAHSEKSKAAILLASLQAVKAKVQSAIPPNLSEQEATIQIELHQLQKQLQLEKTKNEAAQNQERLKSLENQYFDTYQSYQALIQQFEQNYPDYYQLKYNTATAKIEEIQQALSSNYREKPSNALMIAYFIGNEHLYLFGITSNVVEVRQVTKPSNFDQIVVGFNKAIRQIRKKKYLQLGFQLYQLLLQPILEQLTDKKGINQLVLIPHGILTTLPFEALLCSQPETDSNYSDFDYLLLHYNISYHYSATLWLHGLQQQQNKKMLAESFIGFAPVYKDENPIASTELVQTESYRSISIGGNEYQELIYSEEEVQNVRQAFDNKEFISQIFLHKKATKAGFAAHVREKKYVLIAAHGVHNKEQPELSGIIFSPQSNQTVEEAVLYVNDAYHLKLDADLVVLSSCESGIGKLAKGEGMMAINRGFLYAGASNVIFTLFKVYDQQSSQLTQLLFEAILEGKGYPQALRWAKLELIRQQGMDPKAWSGFVLIGG